MKLDRNFYKLKFDSLLIFNLIFVILFVIQTKITIISSYLLAVLYLFYKIKYPSVKVINYIYWSIFFIFTVVSLISLNHGITPIIYFIFTPFLLITSKYISNFDIKYIYESFRRFVYIILFIILIFLSRTYSLDDPLSHIIPWGSRNGITSTLIVLNISFLIIEYKYSKKLSFLTSILTLIISYFGIGRGSLIVSLLTIIFILLVNFNLRGNKYKASVILIFTFLTIYLFSKISFNTITENTDVFLKQNTQFSQGYTDEHRAGIIKEYLNKIDFFSFMWGASYENTSIEYKYDNNPHNSYIRLHSFYGIFGVIILFIFMLNIIFKKQLFYDKVIFLGLLFILLIRGITEPIFFPTPLDYFFFISYFIIKKTDD